MGETNGNVQVIGRIEIVLLSTGQPVLNFQVPNRFTFNAMIETAKQDGLAKLYQAEQQKVVAPPADAAHRLKL